ncbi:primosomal protein N' (replication factor Y) [Nakamurella flavida]|uniref:primosomal protein N' n=1 Tax=Nakamurella flavida TaxID=363630 RepID=UPI00278079FF|nr:primosomal protein N' [Nakamurella flavida]MDP9777632.1 primosomal protein N' (replication factor Y) [Nakamurella flavida]
MTEQAATPAPVPTAPAVTGPAPAATPRPPGRAAAPAARSPRRDAGARSAADHLPVARVAVDMPLAHLDRPFDYLVDATQDADARPGVRVRVRFAGRLVNGLVLDRAGASEHTGRLGFLDRVVSAEPVLSPEVAALARAVADRYAGTLSDVLRLAVPPRHARVEAQPMPVPDTGRPVTAAVPDAAGSAPAPAPAPPVTAVPSVPGEARSPSAAAPAAEQPGSGTPGPADPAAGWAPYTYGPTFLRAVGQGRPARAVWQALPGERWAERLAELALTAHRAGRGALLLVPDARDLTALDAALAAVLPAEDFVTLSADLGPAERYRRFLRIRRGAARVVAGTRGAAFAPVVDLAVVAVFDDGDESLAEPRAPYPHAREVAMLRSVAGPCALLVGGFNRTTEAALLVDSGWAQSVAAPRAVVRERMPRIEAAGDDYARGADSAAARARLTPAAFDAARASLRAGAPVLVQVPRRGYQPALACETCRRPAHCRRCAGPLGVTGASGIPACRWCGTPEARFRCPACGGERLRAVVAGARRTAEELGRAFPNVPVITSAGDAVRIEVGPEAALVIATPGAEPRPPDGYGAALLLDGNALLGRPDLRAGEETVRRWLAAAALVRPAAAGGRVVIGADMALAAVQAVIRWDPAGHADTELAARRELGFPPAVWTAAVQGAEEAVLGWLDDVGLPESAEVLGPVPLDEIGYGRRPGSGDDDGEGGPAVRALVRAPLADRHALTAALRAVAALRSARRESTPVRVRVDPLDLL